MVIAPVRSRLLRWLVLLPFFVLPAACGESRPAEPVAPIARRAAPLWELHSDPWVNLHQRLIAEGTANEYWHGRVDTCACAKGADGSVLPAWEAAVAGYKAELAHRSTLFDPLLVKTNLSFALAGTNATLPKRDIDPVIAKWIEPTFETYLRGQWPADDARNRAWIAKVEPLVANWGEEMATEIAKRFETRWPSLPIRVEVTQYAGFGGAFTVGDPILTTMSSEDAGYQAPSALEMLLHEALHGMDAILDHDLQMAFIKAGKREPRSLDHALIFYTAGDVARKRLGPTYIPYAYREGVYTRGWQKLEAAVREHWQPWLDDKIDLATALERLASASYD